jgi:ABC-type glycerol-3-phosphate transport system substrate-binding protein
VPFTSLPARTFSDTFISGASIFTVDDGTLAIPWAADPLVLYYNRDLLQSATIAAAPKNWQEFSDSVPALTVKKADLTLTQSGAALGTFANVAHAKDIIAMLFLQNGNGFITDGTPPVPHFGSSVSSSDTVGVQAVSFYTSFANPVKNIYSWNAGQPLDRSAFIQSSLAYYFGTASELPIIHATNPNLNFDVALPPQSNAIVTTSGRMYGIAIPKIAPNQLLSYTAATLLSSTDSQKALISKSATTLALMPVRRDVLGDAPVNDPYLGLFYKAALVQKTWFDPNPKGTDQAISTLIKDVSSGVLSVDQALSKAAGQITTFSR